jgi:Glycosyl transferase family 2
MTSTPLSPSKQLPIVPGSDSGLLTQLPSPPWTKTGWPWTIESQRPAPSMPNGQPWTKITIVTPSYNQGEFLEETIRSVLLQNYPNLEYVVMDGGSTDDSRMILEKYNSWLSRWCSEKDRGQTHAINRGFQETSGVIRGYLNSDDLLLPNTLQQVAQLATPGEALLIVGNCVMGGMSYQVEETRIARSHPPQTLVEAISRDGMLYPQPAVFWTEPDLKLPHHFNEQLEFCMDYNFWCQLIQSGYRTIHFNQSFAFYRSHPDAKGIKQTVVMWSELAGLPILQLTKMQSFEEKLQLIAVSRRRLRHYLRLEISNIATQKGQRKAILAFLRAVLQDPFFLLERSSLGLGRQLLLNTIKP